MFGAGATIEHRWLILGAVLAVLAQTLLITWLGAPEEKDEILPRPGDTPEPSSLPVTLAAGGTDLALAGLLYAWEPARSYVLTHPGMGFALLLMLPLGAASYVTHRRL